MPPLIGIFFSSGLGMVLNLKYSRYNRKKITNKYYENRDIEK